MAKPRIVVTGGSGELGTLVLRRLLADRKVGEVVSLDVRPPMVCSARLRAVSCDVRDPDAGRHLEGADALVHLAFIVTASLPAAEMDGINVEGSKNVFRAAARAGVKRIVYTSSVAAYGVAPGHPRPILESTPRVRVASFAYSRNKFDVEAFLDEFEPAHPEIAVARLRPGILIGRHMEHALGDALRHRIVPDTGATPWPIVWDEDVADAILLALDQGARGAFNLSASEALTTAELARAGGLRLVPIPSALRFGITWLWRALGVLGVARPFDPSWIRSAAATLVMSSDKARAELGWRPRASSCEEVIRRYVETVPRRLDRRIALFLRLVALAARHGGLPEEGRHMSARIHLLLTGPRGGDVGLLLDRGRLTLEPRAPRPPTATVTLSPETFLDLLSGRADFTTCGLTGKVRVEGEGLATFLVQALFTAFRARTDFVSTRLQRFFAQGDRP